MTEQEHITQKELLHLLGVTSSVLSILIRDGQFPVSKLKRKKRLFLRNDINQWLDSLRKQTIGGETQIPVFSTTDPNKLLCRIYRDRTTRGNRHLSRTVNQSYSKLINKRLVPFRK